MRMCETSENSKLSVCYSCIDVVYLSSMEPNENLISIREASPHYNYFPHTRSEIFLFLPILFHTYKILILNINLVINFLD